MRASQGRVRKTVPGQRVNLIEVRVLESVHGSRLCHKSNSHCILGMESKIELADQQRTTLGRCLARSDQWQSVELLVLLRDRMDP